jgi:arylsulfatase A-like enzyme
VDPSLVPGILFCNRPVETASPRLIDVAPTVLSLFGVPVPDYMDGKPMIIGEAGAKKPREREKTLAEVAS